VQRGAPSLPLATVPEGLPADLLLRRPDLRDAEQRLVSLNARIGVARAQYFPSISLTGFVGGESVAFSDLFTGPARIFQFVGNIAQPIFNAGRIGYMVDAAEARRDQALLQYKQAVANAFGDVRNALSAQDSARQVLAFESTRSAALESAYKQADLRYQSGIASRLELLDVERNYLQAQLNRLDAERAQRSAVADLFKALGGGWKTQEVAKAP
jgi:multidrug efflux system outer membrane protein